MGMWARRGAVVAVVLSLVFWPVPAQATEPLWRESPAAQVPPDIARINDFMNSLAERMKPALVQVRVRRIAEPAREGNDSPRGPDEGRRGSGSGFIIREDGYIVTNAHVVEGAERIEVKLFTGKRHMARVVGRDERTDLALLKIDTTGLPVALLGDSNRIRVGEFVLALGNPFGLEQTVSFGIVSRKGAPLDSAAVGFDFVQTDAAVNPGNSGGPLVNMAGEVVGVNSMAARNGSIGFAIPVNLVKFLVPQLAEKGTVEWGWLGVAIGEVPEDEAAKYGLHEARGVLVRGVMAGQPAERGGLRPNDVVVAVDGAQVEGPRDLQRIISVTPVGRPVTLNLMRDGQPAQVEVIVGAYQTSAQPVPVRRVPAGPPAAPPGSPAPPSP
ncbi:MAG TPA: trypsin-like peptidase domain-containing protein [Candidatus Binatia bacterium]|nr:trypsin-like peptidase domain-containing protein [Candidatus Binatia bacterium]